MLCVDKKSVMKRATPEHTMQEATLHKHGASRADCAGSAAGRAGLAPAVCRADQVSRRYANRCLESLQKFLAEKYSSLLRKSCTKMRTGLMLKIFWNISVATLLRKPHVKFGRKILRIHLCTSQNKSDVYCRNLLSSVLS